MRLNELRRRGKVVDWLAFLGVVVRYEASLHERRLMC